MRAWTGTSSGLWNNAANWGGSLPAAGDDLVFPAAGLHPAMTNDFPAGTLFQSLTFQADYTLGGNAIVLGAGGIQFTPLSGSHATTVSVNITLGATQTWHTQFNTTLTLDHAVHLNGATLTVDDVVDVFMTGVIDGTGALVKENNGRLVLAGNNSYAGPTTINLGLIEVQHGNALGAADGSAANGTVVNTIDVDHGGALVLNTVAIGNEAITISGYGNGSNGALIANNGVNSIAGPITITLETQVTTLLGASLTLSGLVGGTGQLDPHGGGTLVLSHANNTFSGGIFMSSFGDPKTLRADADNALGSTNSVAMGNGSTLVINNHTQVLAALTGDGNIALPTAGSVLDVGGSTTSSINGTFTGAGTFRYAGTGKYTVNTITGAFSGSYVGAHGTLIFPGSSSGTLSALPGGRVELPFGTAIDRLSGDGGTIAIVNNATAGNASGNAVQLTSASTFEVKPLVPNTLAKLTAKGTVILGNSVLSLPLTASFAPSVGATFTLIDNDGSDPVTGTFAGLPEGAAFSVNTVAFHINYAAGSGNNDVVLTVDAIGRDYLLSEGATGSFFTTDLLLANPNDAPVATHISFLKDNGTSVPMDVTLAGKSHKLIRVNDVAGMDATAFSTVVRSIDGSPIIVERTMSWDQSGYGAHTEHATDGAATDWFFAEGSQGFFHTYLLLTNPQRSSNSATVEYLREGEAKVTRTYVLGPLSRLTVDLSTEDALQNRSFGMSVYFDQPGAAERAMYFGEAPLFNGGHESAGVNAASTTWFLAEGATGPFFETFVLLANPASPPADVTLTYLPSSGSPVTTHKVVPGNSRVTVNIETEDALLANAAVSTQVVSTQPIIVERSQYWPDPAPTWYEAHNSFGVTNLGTRWGLAEGRVGTVDGVAGAQTYILLANPGSTDAHVTITFLRDSTGPLTKQFVVRPGSRFNVPVGPGTDVPELTNEHFGAVVDSDQPIAVERALYWDANNQIWAAGTNATAMRLP